ncbi:DUF3572 domain-containing protein [Paracoccus sp. TK19116]|uniref:DUF3572 domain-containing protein n=1 Tax=Paracoccus albicereus TaxID=2922394 RepID=A0ABT1MWE0_9RHOB|nr:DUF3572 domain-containing protein [Paracoccus albicereus]MCQ0971841.1 DUF3572 domain-containing protein [Paracoccus albicereus]
MRDEKAAAQDVATQALAHIAGDNEMCEQFLANAGIDASQLRQAAHDPDFTVFVLDFVTADDRRLLDFAQAARLSPDRIMRARTILAGPGSEGWSAD